MALSYLDVRGVRNLTSVQLSPSPAVNLVVGNNGSGKSSLLEAIYLLAVGRSFRTTQAKKFVQHGAAEAIVFGRVKLDGSEHTLGLRKTVDGGTESRIDGRKGEGSSELARLLPLQIITPESHTLVSGEPKERRAFMDWGLFHVEHDYLSLWRRYGRYLEQRNAALRAGVDGAALMEWERGVAECGEALAERRARYVELVEGYFGGYYSSLTGLAAPKLSYRRGWTKGMTLGEALARNRESDSAMGYTTTGPHRGDMRLVADGAADAADAFSRGQQKLAVCALRLAQMRQAMDVSGQASTLLMDDLAAELDTEKRRALERLVASTGVQTFITATEREMIDTAAWPEACVFHVERGVLTEMI